MIVLQCCAVLLVFTSKTQLFWSLYSSVHITLASSDNQLTLTEATRAVERCTNSNLAEKDVYFHLQSWDQTAQCHSTHYPGVLRHSKCCAYIWGSANFQFPPEWEFNGVSYSVFVKVLLSAAIKAHTHSSKVFLLLSNHASLLSVVGSSANGKLKSEAAEVSCLISGGYCSRYLRQC